MEHIASHETSGVRSAPPGRRRYADVPLAEKLAVITAWLEEHKAERIVSLNIAEQGGFADALLVLTAGSMRHAQSLADGVAALCHERNYEYLRVEGYGAGQWILVDMNDIVINIFLEPVRELFRLEELWGRRPAGKAATAAPAAGFDGENPA
ncbi:ribosome silencing factor [Desulfovibrio sp. SGI.169]